MGELKNHLPELLEEIGMDDREFIARFMLAGGSQDTGYRLTKGDTKVTMETARIAAKALSLDSISKIIDIGNGQP